MRTIASVALVVLLVLAVSAAWAGQPDEYVLYGSYEDVPLVGWWPAGASGMIAVGGVEFFVIPGNGGGVTLPVRAEIVDARIAEILSAGISGPVCGKSARWVRDIRGQPTIFVGPYRLITVYDIDAVNAGAASAQALALKWAHSVAAALPQVLPSPYVVWDLPASPAPGPAVSPTPSMAD